MVKLTKNRKISIEKIDSDKSYTLDEASSYFSSFILLY